MPRVDCVFLLNPLHLNQFVTEYYQFLMFIFAETLFPEFWHSSWPGVGEHRDVSCRLSLTNPWKTMDHGALFFGAKLTVSVSQDYDMVSHLMQIFVEDIH